jgi:uncharacterized protein YutE (UPF0331/DUF86 family)
MDNKLKRRIAAEEENINIALAALKRVARKRTKTDIELAAMGTFLSNIYKGIENIFKQLLTAKGKEVVNSGNWHKGLIKSAVKNGIISDALAVKLYAYLGFRHFFIHGYGFMLKWDRMKPLASNIDELWRDIKTCISEFVSKINNE